MPGVVRVEDVVACPLAVVSEVVEEPFLKEDILLYFKKKIRRHLSPKLLVCLEVGLPRVYYDPVEESQMPI